MPRLGYSLVGYTWLHSAGFLAAKYFHYGGLFDLWTVQLVGRALLRLESDAPSWLSAVALHAPVVANCARFGRRWGGWCHFLFVPFLELKDQLFGRSRSRSILSVFH